MHSKTVNKTVMEFKRLSKLSKQGLVDYLSKKQKYYLFSELKKMKKDVLLMILKGIL